MNDAVCCMRVTLMDATDEMRETFYAYAGGCGLRPRPFEYGLRTHLIDFPPGFSRASFQNNEFVERICENR